MDIYHVLNRGVDKRAIVLDDHDRLRFIHDLYAFNDGGIVQHISQPERAQQSAPDTRKVLVDIHAFCLMDNHYHLLLSERADSGISRFIQKLNMGYSKYFNERYGRTGTLWQGKYKKIDIRRDAHFIYIPYYLHLNPLDYSMPEWRNGKVQNPKAALHELEAYRWSSHLDYLGKKNFRSVLFCDLLAGELGTRAQYERELRSIISNASLTLDAEIIE